MAAEELPSLVKDGLSSFLVEKKIMVCLPDFLPFPLPRCGRRRCGRPCVLLLQESAQETISRERDDASACSDGRVRSPHFEDLEVLHPEAISLPVILHPPW